MKNLRFRPSGLLVSWFSSLAIVALSGVASANIGGPVALVTVDLKLENQSQFDLHLIGFSWIAPSAEGDQSELSHFVEISRKKIAPAQEAHLGSARVQAYFSEKGELEGIYSFDNNNQTILLHYDGAEPSTARTYALYARVRVIPRNYEFEWVRGKEIWVKMPLAGVHPKMTQCQSAISVSQELAENATLASPVERRAEMNCR